MTDFSVDWLRCREPLDERARAVELTWGFGRALPAKPSLIDLGTGTGANIRHLANKLGRAHQHWTMFDRDLALMTKAPAEMTRWGERSGLKVTEQRRGLRISGDDLDLSLEMRIGDLTYKLNDLNLGAGDGVAANALFDLVSQSWMEEFAAELGAAGFPPLLATCIVDGRIAFEPADPEDQRIVALFAAHQRRDKGFGPALGSDAPLALVKVLQDAGYHIDTARSDWRAGRAHKVALSGLIGFHRDAGLEQDPEAADAINGWTTRRQDQIQAGLLEIMVGQADILATR